MDGFGYKFLIGNPSVLMNLIRPQYVVVLVKRLKVLATCRELWVSGKPSNSSARQMDIPPLSRRDRKLIYIKIYIMLRNTTAAERVWLSVVGESGPAP